MTFKAGFEKKIKGQLTVDAQALTFSENEKVIFTLPIESVMKASNAVENNSGGMGRKVMFGAFSNRSEEAGALSAELRARRRT